ELDMRTAFGDVEADEELPLGDALARLDEGFRDAARDGESQAEVVARRRDGFDLRRGDGGQTESRGRQDRGPEHQDGGKERWALEGHGRELREGVRGAS